MLRKLLLLIFILFFSQIINAQYKEDDFEHYTVLNGLSDNNVYCIAQDDLGYIWIGTEMGLNCFNGENFTHYFSRSKPLYLAASNITKLIPFSDNRLGIITRQGFQVINTVDLSTENYLFPDTCSFAYYNNGVMDAIELPDRSVLLCSATGIYSFNKPGYIYFRYDDYYSGDNENKKGVIYGRAIVKVDKKEAIIYTADYKLDRYDFEKKTLFHISPSSTEWNTFYPKQTHGSNCTKIAENQFILFDPWSDSITFYDRERNMYVASRPSCMSKGELDWESNVFVLNDTCFAMNCPLTGYYLFQLNKKTGMITSSPEKFLPSYRCNYLFVDNEKRLWVGTRTGLLRQKKSSLFINSTLLFNTKDPGFNACFTSICRYKDKLYIGSHNRYQGLFVVDTATMSVVKKITFFGGNNGWSEINSIQCYQKDTLWLGTTNGLLWVDINSFHYGGIRDKHGDTVLAGSQPILCPPDKKGRAWLYDFMNGKAGFYDTAKRTFTFFTLHTTPTLPFTRIKHIVYDAYGDTWLAGHGLARWNNSKQQFDTMINIYEGPNKFKDDILAIAADKQGSLWMYNAENVLLEYKIKEKKFYEHGDNEGLPSFVQSMADEVNDKLWFTTGSQLICFNHSTKKVVYFDYKDGMPAERASTRIIDYDPGRNCYYSLHNNYLATFPADIPGTQEKNSHLLISEIAFADTTFYNPNGTLHLNYTQQNFSIHFNVLNYDAPHSYNFFYSVNSKKWINLDGQEVIFFNELPFGNNHIQVKAVSKLGQELITGIFLNISPPFWNRWWFIALVCVLFFAAVYSIYRYRLNQVIKLQAMRNGIARDLHDDIGSTMGSINLYSQVASEKLQTQQPVVAEEILQKIGTVSRQMVERMGDIVWSINSSNDYLENLVDRMKTFCSMALTPASIDFQFNVNDKFSGTKLSMDKRRNIFLIFKECIHNTLKYAGCNKVTVTITDYQSHILIMIGDDGKGFDIQNNKAYNGNGLKNMQQRASAMHAKLKIHSVINEGTRIELMLDA